MLGLLLAARDAENASDRLSDTEVANQVLLFLIAGRETTAVTLACTLVQLALAPRVANDTARGDDRSAARTSAVG